MIVYNHRQEQMRHTQGNKRTAAAKGERLNIHQRDHVTAGTEKKRRGCPKDKLRATGGGSTKRKKGRKREMTNRQIDNRAKRLAELEAERARLDEEIEKIKDELKKEIEQRDAEQVTTARFAVKWAWITKRALDNKALKADMPDLYERYSKETNYRRFALAAV